MKTLHLDTGREMHGGQWQVLRLVRGLAARGDEPLLMARGDGPLFAHAKAEKLPVRPFSAWALPASDLIHAHDARSHSVAAMLGQAPLVVSRRVAFPVKRGVVSRWKYRQPHRFIAVSRFAASVLLDAGVPDSKIRVVYDGVPLLPVSDRSGPVITPATKFYSGPYERSVDLVKDLEQAAAMVYITECEGLGSAVLLAMSAGVPVVASNIGGIPEIVDNGVDGLLVKNTRVEIEAAVSLILRDPDDYGKRSPKKVREEFSEMRMVEETWKVYRSLLLHS